MAFPPDAARGRRTKTIDGAGAARAGTRPDSTLPPLPSLTQKPPLWLIPEMTSAGTTGFREMTFEGAPRFVELVELRLSMDWLSRTYAAFDRKRGEQVWIKEASRDKDARPEVIAQEYALFRQLALTVGPHVPGVHELFEGDGGIAYSREPLQGVDLASYFYDHVKDEARIRRTFHGLVAALDGLHGLGFVHRNILPVDVLVTPEGRAVLTSLEDAAEAGGRSLEPIGNPRYTSFLTDAVSCCCPRWQRVRPATSHARISQRLTRFAGFAEAACRAERSVSCASEMRRKRRSKTPPVGSL